jgi:hypothetical protein
MANPGIIFYGRGQIANCASVNETPRGRQRA